MDQETENRIKKKIMANEELSPEEKALFVDYDGWKAAHDQARKDTIEGLRWNAWPVLFICAFFLVSTAFNNVRYLMAVEGNAPASVYVTTALSSLLGLASVVGAFFMKHKANEISRRIEQANRLMLAREADPPADDFSNQADTEMYDPSPGQSKV